MDFQTPPVVASATDDGLKLVFDGPIHTNVTWLEEELDKVVAAKPRVVQIDMTRTDYISSLGIGILVSFNNRINANGGILKIIAIPKRVFSTFRVAYLDRVLKIEPAAIVADPH
ncbi:MAG TPA: STAS domain-containing protein [Tepidisphaeraceae bacterium]|nr:STAS domain-containing protein [Tepidisphaeraceae bacterium]